MKHVKTRRTFEIRAEQETETGELRGHAAIFNSETVIGGMFRELISPGAFARTIRGGDQVALWNHDTSQPLGRKSAGTLTLMEDERGLAFSIMPGQTTWQRDAAIAIKQGDVKNMSFGFEVLQEDWKQPEEDGGLPLRTIKEVKLYEISPVTFPAYADTEVEARAVLESAGFVKQPHEATTSDPCPAAHSELGADGNETTDDETRKAKLAHRMKALALAEIEMEAHHERYRETAGAA